MISAGDGHSIAFTDGAEVFTWGENRRGQLGDGARTAAPLPAKAFDAAFRAVSAGGGHSLGLTEAGEVQAWGGSDFGQLGDGSNFARLSPVTVLDARHVVRVISAGWLHSLAVTDAGELFAWGSNKQGQLGPGPPEGALAPRRVALESAARSAAAGCCHSLALTRAGEVLAWGADDDGQLGGGTSLPRGVKAVAAGGRHSLALTDDGEVLAWGANAAGQLGDGSTESRAAPARVDGAGLGNMAITAGYEHSLALSALGEVLAWGSNAGGQLGDGSTTSRSSPVRVFAGQAWAVAAGRGHSLLLASDVGECYSWGCNAQGQLGTSFAEHALVPTRILENKAVRVHPMHFAISLAQLGELAEHAQASLGAGFRRATWRSVVDRVIRPLTANTVNRGYARLLNEGNLLTAQVFVSHAWDGGFEEFVATVRRLFAARGVAPNLWLCATALWQGADQRDARLPRADPSDGPAARALRRVEKMLVVRSERIDVYTRLWCVWELFLADRQGFRRRPEGFLVAGSNKGFESSEPVVPDRCEATEADERQRLLAAMGGAEEPGEDGGEDGRARVGEVATELRRTYFR